MLQYSEEHCLVVNQPDFRDINYTCELDDLDTPENNPSPLDFNNEEMFIIFRSYMEPTTLVSPDDNELPYDRVIYCQSATKKSMVWVLSPF
jgi:hypothetical protein